MVENIVVVDSSGNEKNYEVVAMFNHENHKYLAYKDPLNSENTIIARYENENNTFKIHPISDKEFNDMKEFLDTEIFGGIDD